MIDKLAIQLAPDDGFRGLGDTPLNQTFGEKGVAIGVFANIISTVVGVMTIVAIIWFVFLLIGGAIGMMTAGGDKAAVEGARKRITSGIIGIFITIAAIFIVSLFGYLLGIDFLDIPGLFNQVTP